MITVTLILTNGQKIKDQVDSDEFSDIFKIWEAQLTNSLLHFSNCAVLATSVVAMTW